MTTITRRRALTGALAGAGALLAAPALLRLAPARAATRVVLGVGGKPLLYYLPLTIAERRGTFAEEGLNPEINDFGGGAKSLQAMIGGSVDAVTGAYEHTIRMQAKGQDVRALIELGRFPAIVIAVRKDRAERIKSVADLKGARIGVTAPGSSTMLTAQYALVKAGLKASDASFIGIGGGASAVAAMKKGEIDALSHLDPVISKLEADGDVAVLVDTRTEAGTRALFGGTNPAAVLYAKHDWVQANADTAGRLVRVFRKTLTWLATATPDDVANAVPPEYQLGEPELYRRAVRASLESYSRTGIVGPDGMASMLAMLQQLDPELASAKIDLPRTFDDRFLRAAG